MCPQVLTKRKRSKAGASRKNFLRLSQAVTAAASTAATVEGALRTALDQVCAHTGWPVGHAYLLTTTLADTLISSKIWHLATPDRFEAFRQVTEATPIPADSGLPGRVLSTGKPVRSTDVASDLTHPRARAAIACGLRVAFALPVLAHGEAVGVVEFFSASAVKPDDGLLEAMDYIGAALGQVFVRERAGKQLWETEHFASIVLASVGEGVIVYDRQLRYRVWNRFMEDLTGLPATHILGARALEIFPHLAEQGIDKILLRALAGETVRSPDTPYRVPTTGKTGWVVGLYGPLLSAEGAIVGVVAIISDITERKRLYEAQAQKTAELEALFKLSKQLRAASSPDEMYPILVERARFLLRADLGALALLNRSRTKFARAYTVGVPGEETGSTFPVSGSRSGHVVRTGMPFVTEDFSSEGLAPRLDPQRYGGLGPVVIVPVRSAQETIGTLALGRPRGAGEPPFTEAEIRMLEGVAEIGGTAIQRGRLHQNLEEAYLQIVLALAGAVDARDTYTSDHSERIAMWAEAVARTLGCREDEVQDIRRAARLHDIGKIGIPDSILLKPMALTEAEWGVMRRHPLIGSEILMSVERMRGVAKLVRHHQERWDGTGYPDGLMGEEIPLGARILSVVDAYSAITDKRPYKRAQTHDEAIAELRQCAGTQFDPRVVDVFCRIVREQGTVVS